VRIEDDRIFLPKAGWTPMVMHRPASIQVEHEVAVVPVNRGVEIGIDLGGVQAA
jgi:hypothetical protein